MPTIEPNPNPDAVPELGSDAMAAWNQWKAAPHPKLMSTVLKSVQPTIDAAIARHPRFNAGVLGGEAKRLAIQAVKTFDPAQNASLSTHIFNHLRPLSRYTQEMSRAVSVPREAREQYGKVVRAEQDFLEQNNRPPTDWELQDQLGISRERLAKIRQVGKFEFAEGALESAPDVQQEDPTISLWTDYVYHSLPDRDRQIMDYRLGRIGKTVLPTVEIAQRLGIDPSYVNRRAGQIAQQILDGVNSTRKK
jgi:DNA-directed RNA polymerase specialized sigma subunit